MKRSVAAVGSVSAGVAWERYALLANWSKWAPPILRVDGTADRLEPGLTGVVHGPAGLRISFVVEAVDELAMTWTWRVRSGPIAMTLHHEVLAASDGGTATTLTVTGPAPVVLLYPEVARIALNRLVDPRPLR